MRRRIIGITPHTAYQLYIITQIEFTFWQSCEMGRFAGIAGALRVMSSETWKQAFGKLIFIFIHLQIEILISHNFSCPQPFFYILILINPFQIPMKFESLMELLIRSFIPFLYHFFLALRSLRPLQSPTSNVSFCRNVKKYEINLRVREYSCPASSDLRINIKYYFTY